MRWRRRWESCSRGCRPLRSSLLRQLWRIVARLFAHVRRTGLFAAGVLDAHVERLERLRETYDAGASRLVSSHNDPTPNNILFDGERLWLIDWESACCNDPLVDAAIVLNQFARSQELEDVMLKAWFGRAPDEALHARLAPVRALTHLFYAGVMFSASAAASWMKNDTDLSAPTPEQFRLAIDEGRLIRGAAETRHMPARCIWRHSCPVLLRRSSKRGLAATEIHWANGEYTIDRLDE